jgi:integrase
MTAVPAAGPGRRREHASADEFAAVIMAVTSDRDYLTKKLRDRQAFVDRYPDLEEWFAEPLTRRVGRLVGEDPRRPRQATDPISYEARHYLSFLGVTGRVAFDWEWLLAIPALNIWIQAEALELPLFHEAYTTLPAVGEQLGYRAQTVKRAAQWALSRIMLHTGVPSLSAVTMDELAGLADAIDRFGHHPERERFHGGDPSWASKRRNWGSQLFLLHLLLFHTGQLSELPREPIPLSARRAELPPNMAATLDRYLAARRQLDRPGTIQNIEAGLRRFTNWLVDSRPEISSFLDVSREDCTAFAVWLDQQRHHRTGQPYATTYKRAHLQAVLGLFRDGSAWEWPDMPARPLMIASDLPKIPRALPRFIPANELGRLMEAIRALDCPYQRAALLTARWSGARRGEIQLLELDCLDTYPDGTARLRIPAGKTFTERMIPLNDEAAQAIRHVQALRRAQPDRALPGHHLDRAARRLFARKGRVLSVTYLFDDPLDRACAAAGLVTPDGRRTVSAHRFRHTVGTQLAERGARLHTIMSVLGHTSVSMSLVYAQITDPEVLADYQAVLGADATIAGPSASAVRNGELPAAAVEWLKANFFKTELELGHCLRLPAEGPCECDLYLTCAKFVTTAAYAPRLRQRHTTELVLAAEAAAHGWSREAERHAATARRITSLLDELHEPLVCPDNSRPIDG